MSESLVINALTFWVGKLVLKQISPLPSNPQNAITAAAGNIPEEAEEARYAVLETLSSEAAAHPGTTSAAIAAAAAETASSAPAPALLS